MPTRDDVDFVGAARVWVDALTYAVAVSAVGTGLAILLGIVTGGGMVRGKQLLFVFGWVAMAYATFKLWPSSPDALEDERGGTGVSLAKTHADTRFQAIVNALPPRRWVRAPRPNRRVSVYTKLFLGSVLMLAISYVMETQFDIA